MKNSYNCVFKAEQKKAEKLKWENLQLYLISKNQQQIMRT